MSSLGSLKGVGRLQQSAAEEAPDGVTTAARRAIEQNPVWYHTLELAPGVVTPGYVDLRRVASKLLPDDLGGRRALDIGTFDGFWAFELERRGASVVAIDLENADEVELPPNNRRRVERATRELDAQLGRGFQLAAEVLGSRVERKVCNVLELAPEVVDGPMDIVFMGALLLHLRDPVAALERVLRTLAPLGELYQLEPVSLMLSFVHPRRALAELQTVRTPYNWWYPNRATLEAWLRTAGFEQTRRLGLHRPPARAGAVNWYQAIVSRRPA